MPRLKRFNKNKISTKNVLISFAIIIGLLTIGYISKSYAIYKLQQDYDLIKNKIGSFTMGDVRVAVLVDGKEASEFPSYETNYKVESVECTNGVTASFDVENWQINIADMSSTSTKCTVSFNSKETNEIKPVNMSKTQLLALNEEYQNVAYENLKTQLLNDTYPVGSIYMSTEDNTVDKVKEKFGGTWVKYSEGRTLIGVGSNDTTTYNVNDNGGSETHSHGASTGSLALSANQLPKITGSAIFGANIVMNSGNMNLITRTSGAFTTTNNPAYARAYVTDALVYSSYTKPHVLNMSFGGGQTHAHTISSDSNMQPYTVLYMYKRTA